jgi:hypothetical protein
VPPVQQGHADGVVGDRGCGNQRRGSPGEDRPDRSGQGRLLPHGGVEQCVCHPDRLPVETHLQAACWNHPHKPKRWIVQRYYGKFDKFRGDQWVSGDRNTGAYLPKPSWTDIVRHTLVKGRASPDDLDLTRYWAQRRRRIKPPLDSYTVPLLSKQDAWRTRWGDDLLIFEDPPQNLQAGNGGTSGSPRRRSRRTTSSTTTSPVSHASNEDTWYTRTAPRQNILSGQPQALRNSSRSPNRPRGLLGPYARERARTIVKGSGAAMRRAIWQILALRHQLVLLRLLVRPDTILRWHGDLLARRHAAMFRPRGPGRPPTVRSVRALALCPAAENPVLGYRRVHGELLTLGRRSPRPRCGRSCARLGSIPLLIGPP